MSHYSGSVPDAERAVDWRDRGACSETGRDGKPRHDPELFFPVGNSGSALLQVAAAKAVCARCPSVDGCLQWALETDQEFGVWGGLSEDERRVLRRRRHVPEPVDRAKTVQELWNRHAVPLGNDHVGWDGPNPGRTVEEVFTPMQAAFFIDRGRRPVGKLTRSCDVKRCIWHIQDAQERVRCGTTPGYRKHLQNSTEPCGPCRQANADADRRLAWTGTTKQSVVEPKRGPGGPRGPRGPRPECGTPAAYHQHRRYGEPVDDACRAAHTKKCAEYKQRVKVQAATP